MNKQKFRQAIFVNGTFSHWHYWGFIEEQVTRFGHLTFVAPEMNLSSIEEACKNSYQCTGLKDKNGEDIYEGGVLQSYPTQDVVFVVGHGKNDEGDSFGFTLISTRRNKIYAFETSVTEMETIGNIVENPELTEGAESNV